MNLVFRRPEISARQFMLLLCASLVSEKKTIVDVSDITKIIYNFKHEKCNPDILYIFEDIEFRAGSNNVVSSDISTSLNNMQTLGVIGRVYPSYSRIMIYLTPNEADEILAECAEPVREAMKKLANLFSTKPLFMRIQA
ncbi:MAG: hypothetical protein LBB91_01715 [Clostridiales bacterium]|jgi:hypothetical protein|nr:hypothetical protein [Clostridiales bacterium]